ncbi:MAG: outer membrane lipoprotein-sorting protein [Deltaproteobacteria bacterium]|nr:outer membrane lipoprotein-sorting protein [Deltaproteobacteria bacterium]
MGNFKKLLLIAVLSSAALTSPHTMAWAGTSADAVMRQAIKHLRVPTEQSRIKMILVNRRGQKRTRIVSISSSTTKGHDRSVARFNYPGGIRGTALVSHEGRDGKDTQWLFMPVLGRTRRIATTQMGDSFMGSELAYEDIKTLRVEDWSYKMLRKERFSKRPCWVIESRPVAGHDTSYGKTETWIDVELSVALKTMFFDKEMRPLKVVVSQGIEQVATGIWRARRHTFISLRTKKKTVMDYEKIVINAPLEESIFDQRRLAQWR